MAKKSTAKSAPLSDTQKIGIGVGLTAAVAAAAGSYFLYGSKNAAKNRKLVKSWTLKAKAEVLEALEQAKEMSQDEYEALIAGVTGAYAGAQNISKKELKEFATEMKDHWRTIEKTAAPKAKAAKKAVKQTAVKAGKEASKAAAKSVAKSAVKGVAKKTSKKSTK